MGITKHHGARAIILGLSMTPLGAHAIAEMPTVENPIDLSGLVAEERHDSINAIWSKDAYAEADETEGCEPSGCCDPSGCATFAVDQFKLTERYHIPGQHQVAYVAARNRGSTPVAGSVIAMNVFGGQIVSAPGCQILSDSDAECPTGDLAAYEQVARTIVVRPNLGYTYFAMNARTWTSNPMSELIHPSTIYSSLAPGLGGLILRITQIDSTMCPSIHAIVSETDDEGNALRFLRDMYRFTEDDRFVIASALPASDMARSIAILIDNSAALQDQDWNSMRAAIAAMVNDWQQWSSDRGFSVPYFALYEMAPVSRRLAYSSDPETINSAVAAIVRHPSASNVYAALDVANADLSKRIGQRTAVVLAGGGDAQGAGQRDVLLKSLRTNGINVYGVALQPGLEPLMRDLSKATSGFRQTPQHSGQFSLALQRISRDLQEAEKYQWITPFRQPAYRTLGLGFGNSGVNASSSYTPYATGCASACILTREAPARFSQYDNLTVSLTLSGAFANETLSISESVPTNAWVVDVSDGGYWDQDSSTVYWDLPAGEHPKMLSYSLMGGIGIEDDLRFSGSVKGGNGLFRTCGSSVSESIPLLPAGIGAYEPSPKNVDAYVLAWKAGSQWLIGSPQIPVSHVTRTKQIQMSGFSYRLVDVSPPWVVSGPIDPAGPRSSARMLPEGYQPGIPFPVDLDIDPGTLSSANAVEEVPPAGWLVGGISEGGLYDPIGRMIRWGPYTGDVPRSLSYTLTPPADAYGPVVFSGRLSVDGVDSEIEGTSALGTERIFANGFD